MAQLAPTGQFGLFLFLLKARPAFRRLFLGHIISLLGDWLSYIAVSMVALNQGEGALTIALVYVAHTLPTALISPISGPLADRFDRRLILVGSYFAAAALTVLMLLAANAGWLLALQGVLLIRGCVSGLAITARNSAIPMLVEPDELHGANTLLGLTWSVAFTTGMALGGLASALLSPVGAIGLDALTFVMAAVVTLTLPKLPPPKGKRIPQIGFGALIAALHRIRTIPGAQYTLLAKTPACLSNAGGWIALNLLAAQSLPQLSLPIALGLLQGVRAIGTGVGPLVPEWLYPRRSHVAVPFIFIGVMVFAFAPNPVFTFIGLLIWGMGMGHNFVNSTAELQKVVPGDILGRAVALDFSLFCFSQSIVAVVAGLLGDMTGDPKDCAVVGTVIGCLAWFLARRWRPVASEVQLPSTESKP